MAYCTLADVKLARRDSPAAADELIQALIDRASDAIDRYVGWRSGAEATDDRYYPIIGDQVFIDHLGATPTEVEIISADGDSVRTLTVADDVVTYPRNRVAGESITSLRLRGVDPYSSYGYEARVKGAWAPSTAPGSVVEACVETVIEWLKADQLTTNSAPDMFEPGSPPARGLPLKARDLLGPFRQIGIA